MFGLAKLVAKNEAFKGNDGEIVDRHNENLNLAHCYKNQQHIKTFKATLLRTFGLIHNRQQVKCYNNSFTEIVPKRF